MHSITGHKKQAANTNKRPERKRRIFDFMTSHPVGVLSTVTSHGEPHGTVIYFLTNDDLTFSFLTKRDTKKYDNIGHNNSIMLTAFDPDTQTVAQVYGRATEIRDTHTINSIGAHIVRTSMQNKKAGLPPIAKLDAGPYAALQLHPTYIRIATYAHEEGTDQQLFESLESFELTIDDNF